jgi:O-antigen ligase
MTRRGLRASMPPAAPAKHQAGVPALHQVVSAEREMALTYTRIGVGLVGLALLVSLWASPDRLASLPWFLVDAAGVCLALAVSGPLLPWMRKKVRTEHLLWLFLGIGFVTLAVTLFASHWPAYKIAWLNRVYAGLPSIRSLPWTWAQQGLHPNQTGGMLALCTAFAAVATFMPGVKRRHRWPATFLTLAGTIGVFMTGSRAALAGLAMAYLALLVVRTSRWLWAWVPGVALVALGLLASGSLGRMVRFFVHDETLDTKLVARLDIWSSAVNGIQDHFFTGIGVGVFNDVMPVRYPYQTVGLSYPVSQAHDLFLDTALAIGIPGAIGFAIVILGLFVLGARGSKQPDLRPAVSLGIVSSVIVYLVFGITDSINFATPTSFIVWLWTCALAVISTSLHAVEEDG